MYFSSKSSEVPHYRENWDSNQFGYWSCLLNWTLCFLIVGRLGWWQLWGKSKVNILWIQIEQLKYINKPFDWRANHLNFWHNLRFGAFVGRDRTVHPSAPAVPAASCYSNCHSNIATWQMAARFRGCGNPRSSDGATGQVWWSLLLHAVHLYPKM